LKKQVDTLDLKLKIVGAIMNKLLEKINKLPSDLIKEVDDFVTFLIERNKHKTNQKIKFSWRGALKDLKPQINSVEMQHNIRKEWEEHVSH